MAGAKIGVPIQKRVAAWASSVVVGVAMYVVFEGILTVAPAREQQQIRGEILALPKQLPQVSGKSSAEETQAAMTNYRAMISRLWGLHERRTALEEVCRGKRVLAVVIGLVAGVGCFALCGVYWLRRGAAEAAAPEPAAPVAGEQAD